VETLTAKAMNIAPISSLIGLISDFCGFLFISYTIIYPKKPDDSDVVNLTDAFGKPLIGNIVTLDYLKDDFRAKLGFWLVVIGFVFQLVGTVYPIISCFK
jgi:hypothetical protein